MILIDLPRRARGHDALSRRSIAMLVGAFHFPTNYGIEIGDLARALEARGFESLFVCEHTPAGLCTSLGRQCLGRFLRRAFPHLRSAALRVFYFMCAAPSHYPMPAAPFQRSAVGIRSSRGA
jgi:hypothetical protein